MKLALLRFTLLVVGAAAPGRAESWTLDRAVATALEKNPDARAARARADGAQARVDQAQAAWRPQVSLSGRYTQTNGAMPAFGAILNQRAFDFGLDFNRPGHIDNLNATGTIAYNLYAGGRATAGRAAARAGAEAAGLELRTAQQRLAAEVVRAALNLRKAREAVGAIEGGVRAYGAAAEVARARFAAGQLLKADLLALEVQLAQTREALSSARHGAQLAARAFTFALGLEAQDATVELVDDDPALSRLNVPSSLDFRQRPERLALQARVSAAESALEAARGGRRPSVNAFASYQYDHGWRLSRHGDSWLAGLAVDMNVFDGGLTAGRVRQHAAELAELREILRKTDFALGLEVEQARLAHADAMERLALSTQVVAQATEAAALSRARFEREALVSADVIGAESRLLEARLRRTFATVEERLALVDLRRALGLTPLPRP